MAKILKLNYYDISGEFTKSNTTLLKYPYLYSLDSSNHLYRLTVISHKSELIATIDISEVFDTYSSSDVIKVYGGCTSLGTSKLYFIAYGRTSQYGWSYYLCELDVDTFTCRSIDKIFSYETLSYAGDAYGCNCKVERLDGNTIRTYNYYSYLASGYRNVYYDVRDVNLDTLSVTNSFSERKFSYSGSNLPYQAAGINPSIINPTNYKQLLYGGITQAGTYFTTVGFTGVTAPTTANTLNNGQYSNVGLFELDGKYYGIGGSLGGVASTDIIQIDPNSLASVKVGESANNVTSNPAIQSTTFTGRSNFVYIIFSSTLMGAGELVEYSIDYTFKDNDGNTLAELTDKLPVSAVNISSAGNDVTVTLTYIDSTTDTVFYTLPSIENFRFFGLSDVPNSKRAMLVEGDNSISIYNDITFYPAYIRYVVPSTTFNIELYQNSAEVNRVDKEDYLAPVGSLIGALREECSMLTPSIVYQSESVPTFNYVYIPIFNRYYFVTSLSSVSKNIWRMELNCDVLMTYKNEILLLKGVIGRQENKFNDFLVDDKLPAQKDSTIEFVNTFSSTLNPFDTRMGFTDYIYVLTVVG